MRYQENGLKTCHARCKSLPTTRRSVTDGAEETRANGCSTLFFCFARSAIVRQNTLSPKGGGRMQWFEIETWIIEIGLLILLRLFLKYYRYTLRKIEEEEDEVHNERNDV